MQELIDICQESFNAEEWPGKTEQAFENLFGSDGGRYPLKAKKEIQFRTPKIDADKVPFSAIIHESNPSSGGYGGMSFVILPVEEGPPMIAMVMGTQGLSPDEHIVGKPGHSRKMNAIVELLNRNYSGQETIAWAKREAVRIDQSVPENVQKKFPEYKGVFERYGQEIYGFCRGEEEILEKALKIFLDFHFEERGYTPLTAFSGEYQKYKQQYFNFLMPTVDRDRVSSMLQQRKYLILQGPPGTGKTRLANQLFQNEYNEQGRAIQFHPNTTYENFVGGLFPKSTQSDLGLQFSVSQGDLLKAVEQAQDTDQNVLLVIDEINRADLSKVLGEAIFCFEPYEEREIDLPYDFGGSIGDTLRVPPNLHVLGTMNTADRSIAMLDVAIRRRFAFLTMWPQMQVVEEKGNDITQQAFQDLLEIFIEYASEDAFVLMPGHSYFIDYPQIDAVDHMQTNLIPLLQEYLKQGYVSNFADAIHAYIQEIQQLNGE